MTFIVTTIATILVATFLQFVRVLVNFVWAGLFWFVWTYHGIGGMFFSSILPHQFIEPGFWSILGLFIALSILKSFSPFNVTSESKSD